MIDIKQIFLQNIAPEGFMDWAYELSYEQIINETNNELWLLWIFEKVRGRQDLDFIKTIAECVNYFRQYLTLIEGLSCLDNAFAYVDGMITLEQLNLSLDIADTRRQELAAQAAIAPEEEYWQLEIEALLLCSMYPENHSNYRHVSELIKEQLDETHNHEKCMQDILNIIKSNIK